MICKRKDADDMMNMMIWWCWMDDEEDMLSKCICKNLWPLLWECWENVERLLRECWKIVVDTKYVTYTEIWSEIIHTSYFASSISFIFSWQPISTEFNQWLLDQLTLHFFNHFKITSSSCHSDVFSISIDLNTFSIILI